MKLLQKLVFPLFSLAISLAGIAQNKPANVVLTLDLGGNSGLYALNAEYEIGRIYNHKLNARMGFGYFPSDRIGFTAVPLGLNMLTGTKNHHLELGLGASYIKGIENMHIPAGSFGNAREWWKQSEGIYFVPSVGYRYDKLAGGFILKVYYSPLVSVYDFFDKERFLNELIPVLSGNLTKEEYYNHAVGSSNAYPTAKSKPAYVGISVGYRF